MSTATDVDNTTENPAKRADLVLGGHTYSSVTERVASLAERPKPPKLM